MRRASLIFLSLIFLCGLVLALSARAGHAEEVAAQPCRPAHDMLDHLREGWGERPVQGAVVRGGLLVITASPGSRTCSILMVTPDGTACMLAACHGWTDVPSDEVPA